MVSSSRTVTRAELAAITSFVLGQQLAQRLIGASENSVLHGDAD
jgi:hypothetical protein